MIAKNINILLADDDKAAC